MEEEAAIARKKLEQEIQEYENLKNSLSRKEKHQIRILLGWCYEGLLENKTLPQELFNLLIGDIKTVLKPKRVDKSLTGKELDKANKRYEKEKREYNLVISYLDKLSIERENNINPDEQPA